MNNQGNQSSRLQRTLEQDRILSISKVPYTKQNNKKTRYKSLILDLNHILFWYNHSLYYVFLYTKKVAKQTVSNYCVHKTPCNTRFYSIFGFMQCFVNLYLYWFLHKGVVSFSRLVSFGCAEVFSAIKWVHTRNQDNSNSNNTNKHRYKKRKEIS